MGVTISGSVWRDEMVCGGGAIWGRHDQAVRDDAVVATWGMTWCLHDKEGNVGVVAAAWTIAHRGRWLNRSCYRVAGPIGGNERYNVCVSTAKTHPSGNVLDPPCCVAVGEGEFGFG